MGSKSFFYVVYVSDESLQKLLDSICLICEPGQKNRAHITVRGPYRQRYNMAALARSVHGAEILVDGVDRFFNESQNTVFLRCKSEELKKVWYKKDFGDFRPHITLYDGNSREFAQILYNNLSRLNLCFNFVASGMQPLLSEQQRQMRYFDDIEQFIKESIGVEVDIREIDKEPLNKRAEMVVALAGRIVDFAWLCKDGSSKHSGQKSLIKSANTQLVASGS